MIEKKILLLNHGKIDSGMARSVEEQPRLGGPVASKERLEPLERVEPLAAESCNVFELF